jgi:hypothetical protein
LPCIAYAEDGYRAKFTISITISDEFAAQVKKAGGKAAQDITAADLEVQPLIGNTYFTRTAMRVDYPLAGSNMIVSTLVDFNREKYTLVNHALRSAWEVDFATFREMDEEIGMPVSYPEQVFCRWQDIEDSIKALPGAKVTRLGVKKVAGESCQGLRFSVKLEDVFKADGFAPMGNVAPVRDIKGPWLGEFWISERFGLPVTMKMDMLGVEYKWELDTISDWTPIDALFQIPRGYTVHTLSAGEMVKALSL